MTESGETLGEKKRVDLRTVWPHELDFSRWLAENIETLTEQVIWEIDSESVRQEVPMGSMRVDLLVEATALDTGDRFKVVIENQLGMTDGGHLAGVMAFQKGAIWIAGDVSHEYVEVVRWLNKESSIDAYLFIGPSDRRGGDREPARHDRRRSSRGREQVIWEIAQWCGVRRGEMKSAVRRYPPGTRWVTSTRRIRGPGRPRTCCRSPTTPAATEGIVREMPFQPASGDASGERGREWIRRVLE